MHRRISSLVCKFAYIVFAPLRLWTMKRFIIMKASHQTIFATNLKAGSNCHEFSKGTIWKKIPYRRMLNELSFSLTFCSIMTAAHIACLSLCHCYVIRIVFNLHSSEMDSILCWEVKTRFKSLRMLCASELAHCCCIVVFAIKFYYLLSVVRQKRCGEEQVSATDTEQ